MMRGPTLGGAPPHSPERVTPERPRSRLPGRRSTRRAPSTHPQRAARRRRGPMARSQESSMARLRSTPNRQWVRRFRGDAALRRSQGLRGPIAVRSARRIHRASSKKNTGRSDQRDPTAPISESHGVTSAGSIAQARSCDQQHSRRSSFAPDDPRRDRCRRGRTARSFPETSRGHRAGRPLVERSP